MESSNGFKSPTGWAIKYYICVIAVMFMFPIVGFAQTWNEIFKQKKTQIKYLGEQIAALQLYTGYLKQGYDIAAKGIGKVRDLRNGEFNLHNAFIGSLKVVNTKIKNSPRVADIIACQLAINKGFNSNKNSSMLSQGDRDYINSVKENIQRDCTGDLDDLLQVITSGKLQMKDDERIKKLEQIYQSMSSKSAFTQSFCNSVGILISQRERDIDDLHSELSLNGITL